MKVLVTGAAGYIGSKLVNELANRCCHDVVGFDNFYWGQSRLVYPSINRIRFYNEDVNLWSDNLKREIASADCIIPLAALVGMPLCDKHPDLAIETNYTWFTRLKDSIRNQLVIYPNTNSSYGSVPGICTEETPVNPISLYAKTKQDTEDLLKDYHNFVGFRLATVFGWSFRPRFDLLVNNLTITALKDKNIQVFDGQFRRNYVHVDDVVDAFLFMIEKFKHGSKTILQEVYNLGNDNINMTKLDLVKKICDLTETDYTIVSNKTDPDKRDYEVSSQKLYSLGFKPTRILEYGVKEMMSYDSLCGYYGIETRNY